MPIVADAAARVSADIDPFVRDLKRLDQPVQSLGARIKNALSPTALFGGALATGFAATKIADYLGDAVTAASNLGETVSKTSQIFGEEALPELERWAEGAATAFGQSKQQALDAASTFAIFGKSAGLAGDDLTGFSRELVELSADFASFFNTSPDEAIMAIGAALRGESEPIRRYGVLLDEATLRQRALKLGIIETTTQALTPQQRVLAAQAEILAQTSDAQGDFVRTSGGLANQSRILQAELANLQTEIGEELLPVVLDLTRAAADLAPVLVQLIGPIIELARGAAQALSPFGGLVGHFQDLADAEEQHAVNASEATRGWVQEWGSAPGEVGAALTAGAGAVDAGAAAMADGISEKMKEAREDSIAEARALPGDIARALRQGQEDVESGMADLTALMEESLSDAAKMTYLKGVLSSEELAAGLVDERADVRAAAKELKEEAEYQLALLESGAADIAVDTGTSLDANLRVQQGKVSGAAGFLRDSMISHLGFDATSIGETVGRTYGDGLGAAYSYVFTTAEQLANAVRHHLRLEQSPPYVAAREYGEKVAEFYGEGLEGGLGQLAMPNVLPSAPLPAMAGAGVAGGVTNQWILNVSGVPYSFNTKDDFIRALDDLASFNEGRID